MVKGNSFPKGTHTIHGSPEKSLVQFAFPVFVEKIFLLEPTAVNRSFFRCQAHSADTQRMGTPNLCITTNFRTGDLLNFKL